MLDDLPQSPNWPEWMRVCEPALDAMVKAGWATGYGHDLAGLVVQWTELGEERMDAILEAFDELHNAGLGGKNFFHVWTLAHFYSDGPIEPPQSGQ